MATIVKGQKVWVCPYCRWRIEIVDPVDGVDHMLDQHREILISEKPLIIIKRPI
jgi:hypothetical protein